jgi:hypothetical protein
LSFENNAEIVWAKLSLKGYQCLYVGAFYRQPKGPVSSEIQILEELNDSIHSVNDRNSSSQKTIILGGDFNVGGIDWDNNIVPPGAPNPSVSTRLLEILDDHNLTQIHREPTREHNILDLFCTNKPNLVKQSITIPGISDHDIILTDCEIRAHIARKEPRRVYRYSRANWEEIHSKTREFQREFLSNLNFRTPDENFDLLKTHISKTVDQFVPSKLVTSRYKPPWLTNAVKRACRKKQRLFNKAKRTRKDSDWVAFKSFKNYTVKMIRNARNSYITQIIEKGLENNDVKPFWKFIKSQRQDNVGVAPIKDGGKLHTSNREKAELLNKQFKSVFTKDDSNAQSRLIGPAYPPIKQLEIRSEGIFKLLRNLNVSKASGPDNISCRILKELAPELAPCLTGLYTQSLHLGELPKDWLNANISPLFKKGNRNIAANYRPVSLTCVICKILEHVICSHIRNHIDHHGILSSVQHGFRKHHSCESQLLITTHDLLKARDNNIQVDIAVLDFAKAFDTVPHDRVLSKLEFYGINGPILQWISAFLKNRQQSVIVDGAKSHPVSVDSGVPQGTVLGPLVFLLHINDLPLHVSSNVRLFADDCLLYRNINSEVDQILLQKDLDALVQWGNNWGMNFNASKCTILRSSRKKTPLSKFYHISGQILSELSFTKYLGLCFSNDITWNLHIAQTVKKANSVLGFLRRNLRFCPEKSKCLAFKSMVRPLLEYGAPIWDPHTKKNIILIEAVQRRAARFVMNDFRRSSSVTNMLNKLKWPLLEDRRRILRLCLFYKIMNGQVAVSRDSIDLSLNTGTTRRNHSQKLSVLSPRTTQFKYSFSPRTIIDWNNLAQTQVNASSVENFKTLLLKD